MPSERTLIFTAIVAFILLAAWQAYRWRIRVAARADWDIQDDIDYDLEYEAYDELDDRTVVLRSHDPDCTGCSTCGRDYTGPLVSWESVPDLLPDAVTRTGMMAVLRTDCGTCGVDHIGDCYPIPVITSLPAGDYISGKVAGIIRESDQWTWVLGRWEPPASVREHRDCDHAPGESCWLSDMLVSA